MQLVSDPKAQNLSLKSELDRAFSELVESGWYILGKQVEEFEAAFAKYCETDYAIGTGNGTDAITLVLLALEIGPNDEVICPSHTATFTALGISATGAKPVFADIDEQTFTLDPKNAERKITKQTKAIMPVHLYGHPAEMDSLLALGQKYQLPIIEDACQAHGARYKGKRVGSLGRAGCFSFYPTKNLGALGDGGAITTNDPALAEKIKMLRNGGQKNRYEHVLNGRNSRLDELQAALLKIKLVKLDDWNKKRRKLAARYQIELKGFNLNLPKETDWAESVYHLFVIRTRERERLMTQLKEAEIQTQIHYPIPAHQQPIYQTSGVTLPVTENIVNEIVSLPIYPELTEAAQTKIIEKIKAALS